MDDDALTVLYAAVGAGFCSIAAFSQPGVSSEQIVFFAAAGSALGVITGWIISAVRVSRRKQKRTSARSDNSAEVSSRHDTPVSRPETQNQYQHIPTPFRERLATFTHQDEGKVMGNANDFKSSMPFWSIANFFSRVPPKSAKLIRRYLLAIHGRVHGRRS